MAAGGVGLPLFGGLGDDGADDEDDGSAGGPPRIFYAPGTVRVADEADEYTELAVLGRAGVMCAAVPVMEREGGLLIAVPAGFTDCLPGPSSQVLVPAASDDDASLENPDVRLAVCLIDVSDEHFHLLVAMAPADMPSEALFSADGDWPFAPPLAAAARAWAIRPPALGGPAADPAGGGVSAEDFATAAEDAGAPAAGGAIAGVGLAGALAPLPRAGRGRGARGAAPKAAAAAPSRPRVTAAGVSDEVRLLTERIAGLEALVVGRSAAAAAVPARPAGRGAALVGPTYGGFNRTPADAAGAARDRARELLLGLGGLPDPPGLTDAGRLTRSAASRPAARPLDALGGAAAAAPESDFAAMTARALAGGPGADTALRMLELQTLQQLAASLSRRPGNHNPDVEELFGAGDGDGDDTVGVRMTRGSEGLGRVLRNIERHPGLWNAHFDSTVKRTLQSDITGAPWSLLEYTLRRVQFGRGHQDDDMERVMHLACNLHALHRRGPEHHEALGAAIGQLYKSLEQRQRDSDWTLAWLWTGLPDPRPSMIYGRTLAHPAEHAAGIAYLKEMHTLAAHRALIAAGQTPLPYPPRNAGRGGGGYGGATSSGSGAAQAPAAAGGAAAAGDQRSRGGRRGNGWGRGAAGGSPPAGGVAPK
jgi:hypothetical protein